MYLPVMIICLMLQLLGPRQPISQISQYIYIKASKNASGLRYHGLNCNVKCL